MIYKVEYTSDADKSIGKLKKSDNAAYKKLLVLIAEIHKNPRIGNGKPKRLTGDLAGCYSRRITAKHRLVYKINDNIITVVIISVEGHYNDK
jgi:toxin YoeB